MRLRFGAVLAAAITIGLGLVTVFGLLVGDDAGTLSVIVQGLYFREITSLFLQLVAVTVALTIFPIGIFNLLAVHLGRVASRSRGGLYALILILSFALVIGTYFFQRSANMILLETVQISLESALAGLLLFSLVYGAANVTRKRFTWGGALFVGSLLIVLLGSVPIENVQVVASLRDWLMAVPVNAGARGLLLGIALATLVTGVRVLIGQDRSYRE